MLMAVLRYLLGLLFTFLVSLCACVLLVVIGPQRMWKLLFKRWGVLLLRILGIRLQVIGRVRGPAVFIANHESLIDTIILPALCPRASKIVAKREIVFIPLLGWALATAGAMMVDRKNTKRALGSIQSGIRKLPRGWSVIVFPEGTRSLDGQLKSFKKGAFHIAMQTGLPIVPIGLHGARLAVPKGGWLIRPTTIRIAVGHPIDTSQWREDDTFKSHVQEARDAVARCIEMAKTAPLG
jgi:1-acyl-sn-glycerol-3-phosphate acyltransferase